MGRRKKSHLYANLKEKGKKKGGNEAGKSDRPLGAKKEGI